MEFGYPVSSEVHAAGDLLRDVGRAEAAGFAFALIPDDNPPWSGLAPHRPFTPTDPDQEGFFQFFYAREVLPPVPVAANV